MTIERASEIVSALRKTNPELAYDLFDHFYGIFSPEYKSEFGCMFAQLCGYGVATDVRLLNNDNPTTGKER